jgi:hypothetical protein
MKFLTPHTAEWFAALESCNPQQAAMTRQIIGLAKRDDACSVCGDDPASDYKVTGVQFSKDIGATTRLCDDCQGIRASQGEKLVKLT